MPKCKPDSRNVKFTREEDHRLVEFIAMHDVAGTRRRHKAFFDLGPKASEDLDWSQHRSAESWRSRYKRKTCAFDQAARNYRTGESRPRPVKVPPRLPTAPPTIRSMSFQRSDTAFSTDTNVTRSASWTTTTTSRSTPSVTASSVLSRAKDVAPETLKLQLAAEHTSRAKYHRGEFAHPLFRRLGAHQSQFTPQPHNPTSHEEIDVSLASGNARLSNNASTSTATLKDATRSQLEPDAATAATTVHSSVHPNTSTINVSPNASSSKPVAKHIASCTHPQSASAAHVPTPVEAVIPVMTVGVSGSITAPRDVSKAFSAFSSSPYTSPATDTQDLAPAKVPTKVRRSVERTRVMVGEMVAASCVVLRDAGIDIDWEKQSRKRKRKSDGGNDGTPKKREIAGQNINPVSVLDRASADTEFEM